MVCAVEETVAMANNGRIDMSAANQVLPNESALQPSRPDAVPEMNYDEEQPPNEDENVIEERDAGLIGYDEDVAKSPL